MRRCASAVHAVVLCLSVSLSVTSRYCIETTGRIELVLGTDASFHLSHTLAVYYKSVNCNPHSPVLRFVVDLLYKCCVQLVSTVDKILSDVARRAVRMR